MKILVAVKRVVDYNVKVHVLPDNSGVDIATAKMSMNPFDEIAIEAAVRLKEAGKADEIVAVGIGAAKTVDTLRVAMAMGADRSVHVTTDDALEPSAVAKVLAKVVQSEQPDLVLLGKQAIDDDASQVAQMLSARVGMPVATCANKIELDDGTVTVERETDDGSMTVKAALPAIVTADLRLAEPRYVTLPSMMKAKKKPVQAIALSDFGLDVAARLRTLSVQEPPARAAGVKLNSVDELIHVLKNTAKVL